jgi:dihydrolipoamide dehydrogenase
VTDEEVSAFAAKQLQKQGMKILTSAKATKLDKAKDSVTATIEQDGKTTKVTVERVISAVGITGNVEDIGLEGTKVKVEKSHIVVDEWLRTGEPNVYAIGDVWGPPGWRTRRATRA